jgi:uncharacterized protein
MAKSFREVWDDVGGKVLAALFGLLIIGSLFLIMKTVNEVKSYDSIGKGPEQHMITVSGEGEDFVIPDIAEVTFDVSEVASNVATAQKSVDDKMKTIKDYLKSVGIADKDIRTSNYNIYPEYDYPRICPTGDVECSRTGRAFRGYRVTHANTIKIRKTEDAGTVLSKLGELKVTNVSGLNFTVEDEDAARAKAREAAINDAKAKAEVLADQLGVRLGKIVNFSESGNYPGPMYYAKAAMGMGGADMVANQSAAPVSPGENKITTNVTITYEIR